MLMVVLLRSCWYGYVPTRDRLYWAKGFKSALQAGGQGSNPLSSGVYPFLGICSSFQRYPVNEFITGLVFGGQVKA